MGRPRKKTNKKYIFDNFYVNIDTYKKKVVNFQIRFDYQQEGDIEINVARLKREIETQLKKEFQYLERSRHIFEVEMVDTMKQHTARCSLNGYFLIFDDYEEFVLQHAHKVMNNLQILFNQKDFQIILPERTNKYTKTF